MSVLVKGMDMPESCRKCSLKMNCDACEGFSVQCLPLHRPIGFFDELPDDRRRDDCPLVCVPPHGRLIDESVIDLAKYEKAAHDALHNGKGSILYDSGVLAGARAITRLVRNAPTIIQADPAEEVTDA